MNNILKTTISTLVMMGLTACNATETPNLPKWKQNVLEKIPYRVGPATGVTTKTKDGRHILEGQNSFKFSLLPAQEESWNMDSISVLGLMAKNTGTNELVLDLMLENKNATGWSDSALGRTIIKPGEEIPVGIAFGRSGDYQTTHSAYLRMSGKPNGEFRHWHMIDSSEVTALTISCKEKGPHSFELAQMFPLQKIDNSKMGVFPILDHYGQYTLKDWPDKARSDADIRNSTKLDAQLEKELGEPTGYTTYGGWKKGPKFEATGFFRTQQHEGRWWFIDPEGYLFWSYGVNCIGVDFASQTPTERDQAVFTDLPAKDDKDFGQFHIKLDVEDNYKMLRDVPHYDFTCANLFRKYGKDWKTKYIDRDIARMHYCNINTIGAWSDNAVVARKKVPYVAMVHYEYGFAAEKLPDPFNPATRAGLRKAIEEYPIPFKNDPWCLGAFVNNELHWANDVKTQMVDIFGYDDEDNRPVRHIFINWLKQKYNTVEALNTAWETSFTAWDDLLNVLTKDQLKKADEDDCSALTTLLAEAFYKLIDEELERYSPNTLYMGSRFNSGGTEVIAAAAKYADVISANIYWYTPHLGAFGTSDKPVLISEFHFANVSGNNLGSGLRSAQDSIQQGRLFKAFMEEAVDHPQIVGAHWFQWRDQSVAGRYDGENYDVGFFDVADIPNEDLIRSAEEFGRNLYNNIK
ncbi:MAG TPA: beta-galactosidase [Pontiella sp.]